MKDEVEWMLVQEKCRKSQEEEAIHSGVARMTELPGHSMGVRSCTVPGGC